MKPLLLVPVVVVTVVLGASLEPALPYADYSLQPVPIQIQGPVSLHTPKETHQHVLYSYRLRSAIHNRDRRQDPVQNSVPSEQQYPVPYALPLVAPQEPDHQSGFHRGAIEAHPDSLNPDSLNTLASVYIQPLSFEEEELPGPNFQRGAVEHIPIEARHYMAEEVEAEADDVAFSRSAVEAYPSFPTPYSGGQHDEGMDAVVVEVGGESESDGVHYGWAGIRASVESPPLWTPAQDPEEAYPSQVQLNSRPFGQWSESLIGYGDGDDDDDDGPMAPYSPMYTPHNDLDSVAGGDVLRYQAAIRKQNNG